MIRNDFWTGGFPINRRLPVLCFSESGEVFVAYNNFTLKRILSEKPIKKAVGIWPGKHDTDCFPIDPECEIHAPPKEYVDIDSAEDLEIIYISNVFDHISYKLKEINYTSKDESLLDYLKKNGRKYKVKYE